ncbi:MAG: hypothetical protein AAF907_07475 [Planctomycetota bacterium]
MSDHAVPEPPEFVLAAIRGALLSGEEEYHCATLTVETNEEHWVQITHDAFNASYPFSEEPLTLMPDRGCPPPDWASLGDWQPKTYATFEHEGRTAEELGRFAMTYLVHMLGETSPTLDVTVQDLEEEDDEWDDEAE